MFTELEKVKNCLYILYNIEIDAKELSDCWLSTPQKFQASHPIIGRFTIIENHIETLIQALQHIKNSA